jgi:asparagine synthase (glutamine-hydrolysing)
MGDGFGSAIHETRVLQSFDNSQAWFIRRRDGETSLHASTEAGLTKRLRCWPDVINNGLVIIDKGGEWLGSLAPASPIDLFAAFNKDGELLLGGTVAALLESNLPGAALDLDALAERFSGALTVANPRTVIRGVKRIMGGHELRAGAGTLSVRRWWEPHKVGIRHNRSWTRLAAELRQTAEAVVSRNLPADGSVAVHLSGGRDSSLLCALAARQLAAEGRTVHALTALPCDGLPKLEGRFQYDEGSAAAATATRYSNVEHHFIRPQPLPLAKILDDLHRRIGEPVHQPVSLGWLWPQLKRCSDLGTRTLLTGDNGNFTVSAGGMLSLSDIWREEGLFAWARASARTVRAGGVTIRDIARESFGGSLPLPIYKASRKRGQPELSSNDFPFFKGLLRGKLLALTSHSDDPRPPSSARALMQEVAANRCNPMPIGRFDFGVEMLAPWNDRALSEMMLSVPSSLLASPPDRRLLYDEAFGDLLSAEVLRPVRRGRQNVDFHASFDRADLAAAVERYRGSAVCREMIDLDRLGRAVATWPDERNTCIRHQGFWVGQFLPALALASFLFTRDAGRGDTSSMDAEPLRAAP